MTDPIEFGKAVAAAVKDYVARGIAPLERRVEELESKQATSKALDYRGAWMPGAQYKAGEFVTYQGGLWHVNEDNSERPGDGHVYTLAVKAGRPGRDAR